MSRLTVAGALLGMLLALARPAPAQSWDVSFLAGYTPSVGLDRKAPELDTLDVRGGFTFGALAGRALGARWGAEIVWTQQHTAQQLGTADGQADLFTFSMDNVHGNALYHLAEPDARVRPFVLGGLGVTHFSGAGLDSETKFSWDLGAGVKYFPWQSIGLRGQIRYKPVILGDGGSGDLCDPFGFCQSWLNQFELVGGVAVRF